tara:strand:+ start:100663 stop:101748 length:1086 start_codon:yes stop_codon:yes gene_type:complete
MNIRVAIFAAIFIALAAGFVLAAEIVLILFLALLFGVFLTKLSRQLQSRFALPYWGSLSIVVLTLLLTIAGSTVFFFVQINTQITKAETKIDEGVTQLRELVQKYPAVRSTVESTPILSDALIAPKDQRPQKRQDDESSKESMDLSEVPEPVKQAASTIGRLFRTTFGLVVNSMLIFFVGLFIAVSPDSYRKGVVKLVPIDKRNRADEVLSSVSDTLWRWLIGRFGSMLVTGLGAFLILWVIGVPMAATLGIITAVMTFVPNIGAAVSLVLAILFALPQGPTTVAAVVAGYMALQLIESYVVTPLIQQQQVSLPPALLIAFQAIMGVIFGFIGAAVASPILAAAKTMTRMLYVEDYLGDRD